MNVVSNTSTCIRLSFHISIADNQNQATQWRYFQIDLANKWNFSTTTDAIGQQMDFK